MSHNFTRGTIADATAGGTPLQASAALLMDVHGDTLDVLALENELEAIKTQLYMKPYPPNQFLARVNIDTSGGTGLNATGFVEMASRAEFRRLGDQSADFDLADHKRKKRTFPVVSYISGWGYSIREVETAQRLGLNLDMRGADACRKAYDDLLELHAMVGEPEEGIYGFLNAPEIPRSTQATALTSASSAADIFDQLMDYVDRVESNSEGVYMAQAFLVPGPLYRKARRTMFTSLNTSVAARFEEVTGFRLEPVERFKSVPKKYFGAAQTSGNSSVAIIGSFTPMSHEKQVPRPFQQLMPHVRKAGLETVVPVITDMGGLHVYEPGQFYVIENIYSSS